MTVEESAEIRRLHTAERMVELQCAMPAIGQLSLTQELVDKTCQRKANLIGRGAVERF